MKIVKKSARYTDQDIPGKKVLAKVSQYLKSVSRKHLARDPVKDLVRAQERSQEKLVLPEERAIEDPTPPRKAPRLEQHVSRVKRDLVKVPEKHLEKLPRNSLNLELKDTLSYTRR